MEGVFLALCERRGVHFTGDCDLLLHGLLLPRLLGLPPLLLLALLPELHGLLILLLLLLLLLFLFLPELPPGGGEQSSDFFSGGVQLPSDMAITALTHWLENSKQFQNCPLLSPPNRLAL